MRENAADPETEPQFPPELPLVSHTHTHTNSIVSESFEIVNIWPVLTYKNDNFTLIYTAR